MNIKEKFINELTTATSVSIISLVNNFEKSITEIDMNGIDIYDNHVIISGSNGCVFNFYLDESDINYGDDEDNYIITSFDNKLIDLVTIFRKSDFLNQGTLQN